MSDVRTRDPVVGDIVVVDEEQFEVVERCPCGPEAHHIRWFLQGQSDIENTRLAQDAVLAKEWDVEKEFWWWFGHRIALSDLRASRGRLTEHLRKHRQEPPKRLFYEGRLYRLVLTNEPPPDATEDRQPMTVWEYVDAEEIESLLIERSAEGEAIAYHGAYYDPEAISL